MVVRMTRFQNVPNSKAFLHHDGVGIRYCRTICIGCGDVDIPVENTSCPKCNGKVPIVHEYYTSFGQQKVDEIIEKAKVNETYRKTLYP